MPTRLAFFIAAAGMLLGLGTSQVRAQNQYEFTNPAGGNWSTSTNWTPPTTPPFGPANTDAIFDLDAVGSNSTLVPTVIDPGVGNPYTLPNGGTTPSVTLSELSLNANSTYGFSVSQGTLVFVPFSGTKGTGTDGTLQPQIYANTASISTTQAPASLLPLVVRSNISISATTLTAPLELIGNAVANSTAYGNYSIVLGGQIIGNSSQAIAVEVTNGGAMILSNNNSFAGVVELQEGSLLLEGANALGRTSTVFTNGSSNTADGLQIKSDQGKSSLLGTTPYAIMPQQIGQLGYTSAQGASLGKNILGFIDIGDAIANNNGPDTYNPGFILFGFSNTSTTIASEITGHTAANELIKVGTGTATFSGASGNNAYYGGVMILSGGITVLQNAKGSGGLSGGTGNADGYGSFVLNAGGTFTVNNTSLIVQTPLNPTGAVYLNGGNFVTTGLGTGTATAVADAYGALTVGAGQTIFSLQPSTKGNVNATFASGTATGFGTMIANLGVNGADTSSLTFTTAPAMSNGIIPWLLVNATSGTAAPTDLAALNGSNAVVVPTYGSNSLAASSGATVNVKDTTSGTINSSATAVNALVLSGATTLSQTGTLSITSGTILNTTVSSITGGTLAFGTNGYFTTTTAVNITSALTAGSTLTLADASTGGTAPITIGGGITFTNSGGTLAINNGTVNLNSAVSGSNISYMVGTNGNLAVSGGLTISSSQTLTGNGTVTGNLTLSGIVNPASMSGSPGMLTVNGNMAFTAGSKYIWSVASVITDTPVSTTTGSGTTANGSTASWINCSGSLNLTGLSPGSITIVVNSLTAGFGYNNSAAAGTIYDMQPGQMYSWTIASFSGGIMGFNASDFTINSTAFATVNTPSLWSITVVGNNLVLNAITPEPGGLLIVASAGLALGRLVRRRTPRTR